MKQAQKHIVLLNDKTIIELGFAIIDLLATDKSRYFAQPRPIYCLLLHGLWPCGKRRS